MSKKPRGLNATQIIAIAFAVIILLGTLLLMLPWASRSGVSCGFHPALFTATSATCVTGLVLYDTWSQWSGFGQIVIISLIQIGGLGFMSVASLVVFLLRRKVGLKQRMVMAQALSLNDMDGVVRLQKWVIFGSLSVEAVAALILTLRFLPEYGFATALKWGVFHSISAFCNAGFDIFGCITPGASLMEFNSDPVVLLTLGALVIIGGLGFLVWEEVARIHKFKKLSVYTRLVLVTTLALLLTGTVCFAVLEWNNPATIGNMSVGDKLLNSFFQSVTVRTAGFAAVDQAGLTEAGKGLSIALMLVGGSSGSTAGGVKTVTMMVLLLFIWARARGKSSVCVFKRTIASGHVMNAMTIVSLLIGLAVFGSIFICATSPVSFTDALYESVSALATVGLTASVTTKLSLAAQLLMIVFMYFGRVGVLTISLGFLMGSEAEERFRYAQTDVLIG
ncbi:MAG: potassium uptake protein, TrkH family [Oscillospiraceae bacterium]|nr:potassium uptake protein, TrkH family [Oscillospiraceae bacterium]